MLIKILISLFILMALVAIYATVKTPTVVKISRSLQIQASPESVFPFLNNSKKIQEWNPFAEGDTSLKLEFSGPPEGVGAQWSWDGKQAGAGKATIVSSEPGKRVELRLEFKRPFNVTNNGEYTISTVASTSLVTWTIFETALVPRVLSNFIDLDKLVGAQFEKGLLKLKVLNEAKP
jgi:uncharacterized protein YndB with AHSA1/START domain